MSICLHNPAGIALAFLLQDHGVSKAKHIELRGSSRLLVPDVGAVITRADFMPL